MRLGNPTSDHVEIIAVIGAVTRCRCKCGKEFFAQNSVVKSRRSCGCTHARSPYLAAQVKRKEDRRKLIREFIGNNKQVSMKLEWFIREQLQLNDSLGVIKKDLCAINADKRRELNQKRKVQREAKRSAINLAKGQDERRGEGILQVSVLAQDTQVASDPRTTLPSLRSTGTSGGSNRG